MKARVYTVAEVKISKKGEPYALFSIKDDRGKVYKVLAFGELANQCSAISKQGEEIICDGNVTQEKGTGDDLIFLTAFTFPERRLAKKGGSKRPVVGATNQRPYKMWMDEEKRLWVRYEQ